MVPVVGYVRRAAALQVSHRYYQLADTPFSAEMLVFDHQTGAQK